MWICFAMADWADDTATAIVDTPGVLKVWQDSGFCKKKCLNCTPCNQPIAGSLIDLMELKRRIAAALREVKT